MVLYIPAFKMMTLQARHKARKKFSCASGNKACFAERHPTLVWTISGWRSGRERSRGGTQTPNADTIL